MTAYTGDGRSFIWRSWTVHQILSLAADTPRNCLLAQSLVLHCEGRRLSFDLVHALGEHDIAFVIQRKECLFEPHSAGDAFVESC